MELRHTGAWEEGSGSRLQDDCNLPAESEPGVTSFETLNSATSVAQS